MTFCRLAQVPGTISLVLLAYAGAAAAHGVDITADVDGSAATLELTDETGEICIAIDPTPPNSAVVAIVEDASDEVLVILGEGFSTEERCRFFDVDLVNGILADVDAHRLVVAFAGVEGTGVLTKQPLADSETATGDTLANDDGTNVPLVFGAGIGLGVLAVVVRKRFFS